MVSVRYSLAVMCTLSIWNIGYAEVCGDKRILINKQCCDLCLPGEHVKEFCTEHKRTVCVPCETGFFSDHYTIFDRCKECQSCQHEYAEKCTPTTNSNCTCRSGFLCSDNVCSTCEENKCIAGEKVRRTGVSISEKLIKYSYQCEPACPGQAYFDVKENTCKPWTQCSAFGFTERFPGNKTHNSVCDVPALIHGKVGDAIHIILGLSFLLVSLSFFVILFFACTKKRWKHERNNNPVLTASKDISDFHLSKEESGFQLIIPDESKDNSSYDTLQLGKVTTC